jgi:TonB family protein
MSASKLRAWAIGSAVFSAGFQVGAQPQPASPPPQVWKLDWVRNQCAISTGDVATAGLIFLMTPGDPDPEVDIVGSPKIVPAAHHIADPNRSTFIVTLGPGGQTYQPLAYEVYEDGKPRVVELHRLYRPFAIAFAGSDELRVQALDKSVAIPIVGASKAMAAVKQCTDERLANWGVDVKAYNALRVPAADLKDRNWISYSDYPADAIQREFSGQVIARLDVDSTGKVTGCTVVVPSGMPSVDSITCKRALDRGRLEPAIGADGRPTASQRIENIEFKLFS